MVISYKSEREIGKMRAAGQVIAKVFGHMSPETTRRYAPVMPSAISHAAKVLYAAIPRDQPDRVSESCYAPSA